MKNPLDPFLDTAFVMQPSKKCGSRRELGRQWNIGAFRPVNPNRPFPSRLVISFRDY